MYQAFHEEDAVMLEVNPLAETDGGYVALDGMMRLDDDASHRRDRTFPDRSSFAREKTDRESKSKRSTRTITAASRGNTPNSPATSRCYSPAAVPH